MGTELKVYVFMVLSKAVLELIGSPSGVLGVQDRMMTLATEHMINCWS